MASTRSDNRFRFWGHALDLRIQERFLAMVMFRTFHFTVAASRQSAAVRGSEKCGALPRRRYRLRMIQAAQALCALAALSLANCSQHPSLSPESSINAKELFEQTVQRYHLPSAEAQGADKTNLLNQAAAGYERVLRESPDQPHWCAQASRSLGNVRVAQGRLEEALQRYARLDQAYPGEDWEILQAWKTAADLLWEANRRIEARDYYHKIVARFDQPEPPPVVALIVRAAKARLADLEKGAHRPTSESPRQFACCANDLCSTATCG